MTEDELYDEYLLLREEHAALEAEHAVVERRPGDLDAHVAHGERLRDHIRRLHRHMAARGMRVPSRQLPNPKS